MTPIILARKQLIPKEEVLIAKKYFPVVHLRTEVPKDSLVIARYSVLPYYYEVQQDLKNLGARLLNSYLEHQFIADFEYYEYVKEYTPQSWFEEQFPYSTSEGPFIVKGATNSKKFLWDKLMYAPTKADALRIGSELLKDSMIGQQKLIYRQYVPLKTFEIGLNGLPFTNEWRCFFYKEHLLSAGYYWNIAENPITSPIPAAALDFANQVAKIIAQHVNFFVLDIAEKQEGGWILIEINDGQMSGMPEESMESCYQNLQQILQWEAKQN